MSIPDITLGDLSQMKLGRPQVEVTDADVERLIDNLRKSRRTLAAVERGAQKGDVVAARLRRQARRRSLPGRQEPRTQSIEIGERRFLPELEDGVIGHSAGETFDVAVNFPADYRNETLAGKKTVFTVTLKDVREPRLPEDRRGLPQGARHRGRWRSRRCVPSAAKRSKPSATRRSRCA